MPHDTIKYGNSTDATFVELRAENDKLRRRVNELEAQLNFLGQHKTLAAGIRGERLVSRAIGGKLTLHTASIDIVTTDGRSIEVKYAKKSYSDAAYPNYKRWQWQKVFGETGGKDFDYLVLIGEADERYRSLYMDQSSPFVMFCLEPSDVRAVMTAGTRGAHGILLSCNPANSRGRSTQLFRTNQITMSDFTKRFGPTDFDTLLAAIRG